MADWPKPLQQATGPIRKEKLDGAADGMGAWGEVTQALHAQGLVPPEMMTGLTLFLLSNQPRKARGPDDIPGGGGGVAGGVWVRERFTILQPLGREEAFTARGESVGQYVRKGRRYGTTRCNTFSASGEPVAQNITTGLLQYKVDESLADGLEGEDPDIMAAPQADRSVAHNNPALDTIRSLREGQVFGDYPVTVSLAMMSARDTKKPDNPIHSDPELAKKAGLSRPIAGGNHVLSFVLEPVLKAVGAHGLYHGANFDVRWKSPVYADTVITPRVQVMACSDEGVTLEGMALQESGATAMTVQVVIPLP